MELQIVLVGNKRFVNSKELYTALDMNREYYHRWIKDIIKNPVLEEGKDFHSQENNGHVIKRGRPVQTYLFSISLSKTLCVQSGTIVSKKVHEFISSTVES